MSISVIIRHLICRSNQITKVSVFLKTYIDGLDHSRMILETPETSLNSSKTV